MSQVEQVQQALKDLGFYTGKVNGVHDEACRAAVRAYQANLGLKETGEINEDVLLNLSIDEDVSAAVEEEPKVNVPTLRLVKTDSIPDYTKPALMAQSQQAQAPVPPRLQPNQMVPRVAQTAQYLPTARVAGWPPRQQLAAPPDEKKSGIGGLVLVGVLAAGIGLWMGSRKGRGAPIIEDEPLEAVNGFDDAPKKKRRRRKKKPSSAETAEHTE